jgi:hypothetical protein
MLGRRRSVAARADDAAVRRRRRLDSASTAPHRSRDRSDKGAARIARPSPDAVSGTTKARDDFDV